MDGFYLVSNIEPLNSVADGRMLKAINAILEQRNENREEKGELVAYRIRNSDGLIADVDCLIETNYGLHFRNFSYFRSTGTIDDCLRDKAGYGFGFQDVDMELFQKLSKFYLRKAKIQKV